MNNFLNQLNLTPQERRIVAIIFLVVIMVLNFLFVWPHFGEWGSINRQLKDMYQKIENEDRTIGMDRDPTNGWQKLVNKLITKERKLGGSEAGDRTVDPEIQLGNSILVQERKTGVEVQNTTYGAPKTNDAFFEEHSASITVASQEPNLVNFLYNMGNDSAMIRVAKLDLKPFDNARYRLKGTITLTANYAKKPPAPVAPAGKVKPNFAAKPGGAPGTKPGGPPGIKPAGAPGAKPAGPPAPGQPARQAPGGPPSPGAKPQPSKGPKVPVPMPMPKRNSGPPSIPANPSN